MKENSILVVMFEVFDRESQRWEMKGKHLVSIGGIIVVVVLLGIFLASMLKPEFTSANALTEQEARAIAEQRYAGKVTTIRQENSHFLIEIEREMGIYELQLDETTGDVLSLKKIEKAVNPEKPEKETNAEEQKNPDEKVITEDIQKKLTVEEAMEIALKQVPGIVDDVDEEQINGMNYYLVEVESNDGREATVEINAITRKIESLTWDDDDDDE